MNVNASEENSVTSGAAWIRMLVTTSAGMRGAHPPPGVTSGPAHGAMVLRYVLDRRSGQRRIGTIQHVKVRPLPTIAIGMIGGLIVGLTSVGSGSLMIVLMLFLYPLLSAGQLVGTDLTQAVPLTAAAALGALSSAMSSSA
jgi:uncharacterized membrane protein YfcA